MSTIVPTWSAQQTVTMSDSSPADTVTSTGAIDLATNDYDCVLVQISMTFPASCADYVDINIYGSSDGGTTVDSVVLYNRRVDPVSSSTVIISQIIDGIPWARIAVDNECTKEINPLVVEYQGRSWTSS